MKQKVAVARALLHRRLMIFLDEPSAGHDPIAAAFLREDLARLVEQEGITVFLNTHNLPGAEKLCSKDGVIHNGRLLSVGTLDQLRAKNGNPRLEIPLIGVLLGLFLASLMSSIGILVSLRAVTVKQAQQAFGLSFFILVWAVSTIDINVSKLLSQEMRDTLSSMIMTGNIPAMALMISVVLVILHIVVFAAARARFQRTHLILE